MAYLWYSHNLFRFSWLWYGGFLIISRYCLEYRLAYAMMTVEEQPVEEEYESQPAEGWIAHGGHA